MTATVVRPIEVQTEARAREERAVLGTAPVRRHLLWASITFDLAAGLLSYELAVVIFGWIHSYGLRLTTASFDWGLPMGFVAILVTFNALGLYKLEAYVSRPIHLMMLVKASTIALLVTSFAAFAFRAQIVSDSRLTVFVAFALFVCFSSFFRLRVLDASYVRSVRARPGATVVVSWSSDGGVLISRLKELRGYAQVRTLEPSDRRRNGHDAEPAVIDTLRNAQPAPRQVFLDGGCLGHKATLDLVRVARERGADVYVTGRLVSPLDTTHLLMHLFEIPVMRVHNLPGETSYVAQSLLRAFDVLSSGAALLLLSPLFAAIAVAVKLDSRGPVFFRQQRVGLGGRTFGFLKFRSMQVNNDAAEHRECLARFIQGDVAEQMAKTDEWGRPVLKIATDARVTRVGRFLRKYSLDELPQFINVLKGDMSMVGPRPALEYEVEAYKPWHRQRLEITPGVSGLWQIAGRSRVGFDDMVFQDVMYGLNRSLLTDVHICLRTVPAMLTGTGAA